MFYGSQDEGSATQNEDTQLHYRNESYLNLNFVSTDNNISNISQIPNTQYSQLDGKYNKMQEESYMETNENIRFIENLLSDNDCELNSGCSFQEVRDEGISFASTNISYIGTGNMFSKQAVHSKTLSGDLNSGNEKVGRVPPGLGRNNTVFPYTGK